MEIKRFPQEKSTRISLFVEGEDVSGLWVHDLAMRIGPVPVRMGGIGGVSTKRDHQRKGYARKVLEDAVAFMREAGHDVSALFGIPDFYPKFGYAVCMPECECILRTRDAERAEQSLEWSAMSDGDEDALLALYDMTNRARTGSLVRKEARGPECQGSRWHVRADVRVGRGASGEVEACVALDRDEGETIAPEVVARSVAGYDSALAFLAADAISKRAGKVKLLCPPDGALVDAASRFDAELKVARPRSGGPMGRVIDQDAVLGKLCPLFAERLEYSGMAGEAFALRVSTELGGTTLAFDGANAAVEDSASAWRFELPAPALMQALTGYRAPAAVAARLEGARAREAVEALFPRCEAHMWYPDRF